MSQKQKQQDWELAVKKATRKHKGNVIYESAELCHDLNNQMLTSSYTEFTITGGRRAHKRWILENGYKITTSKEATCFLMVGEKRQGCFVIGNYKTYYLKPINN